MQSVEKVKQMIAEQKELREFASNFLSLNAYERASVKKEELDRLKIFSIRARHAELEKAVNEASSMKKF